MPRARKQADILTAKRKRVCRAINTIRKSITPGMPESERHARTMYVQRLEISLKQTYVGRVQNKQLRVEAYARAMENADKLVRQAETVKGGGGKRGERRRSFNIFRQECAWHPRGCPRRWVILVAKKSKSFGGTHKIYGNVPMYRLRNVWRLL